MLHEPAAKCGKDYASGYKTILGVRMFIAYGIFYLSFVVINVLKPSLMEKEIILGLNLASVYGFSLIIVALILALIYNHMCTTKERELNGNLSSEESD